MSTSDSISRESRLSQRRQSRQRRKRIMEHALKGQGLTSSLQDVYGDLDIEDKSVGDGTTLSIMSENNIGYNHIIRGEYDRVNEELARSKKFSPEWLRLKEKLVLLSVQLQRGDSGRMSPSASSSASFHTTPGALQTISSGDHTEGDYRSTDDGYDVKSEEGGGRSSSGHVTKLIESQLLQFEEERPTTRSAVTKRRGSLSSSSSIHEELSKYVMEDQECCIYTDSSDSEEDLPPSEVAKKKGKSTKWSGGANLVPGVTGSSLCKDHNNNNNSSSSSSNCGEARFIKRNDGFIDFAGVIEVKTKIGGEESNNKPSSRIQRGGGGLDTSDRSCSSSSRSLGSHLSDLTDLPNFGDLFHDILGDDGEDEDTNVLFNNNSTYNKRRGNRISGLRGMTQCSPKRVRVGLAIIASIAVLSSVTLLIGDIMTSRNKSALSTDDDTSSNNIVVGTVTNKIDTTKNDNDTMNILRDDDDDDGDDDEPNPPPLPDSMRLFHPPQSDEDRQAMWKSLREYSDPVVTWEDHSGKNEPKPDGYPDFTYTAANHFTSKRTALLFAPGEYPELDFEVGYYTSIIGLGTHPDDVLFTDCTQGPHIPALEKFTDRPPNGSGLDTVWRSIENVAIDASEGLQWAVSQGAPLRRVHIQADLNLHDHEAGVSGGVVANAIVDGIVDFGEQKQSLMRNVELKDGAVNGAWLLVYVGCTGKVPEENDGMEDGPSISVENKPRVRVEKPYITMKTVGRSMVRRQAEQVGQYQLELRVPKPTFGDDTSGPQFKDGQEDVRDFKRVKLAVPSSLTDPEAAAEENHSTLQKALNDGKDVVLSPGIYHLSKSLKVSTDNQVILGLGYATLVAPPDGSPCISVHSWVPGVRIAGIMLEASALSGKRERESSSLLQWGSAYSDDPGDAANPGVLTDVYARVGGVSRDVSTDVMMRIHSGNIYGDNIWLWRADHVKLQENEEPNFPHISLRYRQTEKGECEVKNGLVVGAGAKDVTMVGLSADHTLEHQTIWMGENGHVYAYHSELPHDADQTFANENFAGYKVYRANTHKAVGLGIYSNFRDHDIDVWTGIVHPESEDIEMKNLFTVKLDNEGKISTVVNGYGLGPIDELERGHPYRCVNEKCN